jgi:hypothetical protein
MMSIFFQKKSAFSIFLQLLEVQRKKKKTGQPISPKRSGNKISLFFDRNQQGRSRPLFLKYIKIMYNYKAKGPRRKRQTTRDYS